MARGHRIDYHLHTRLCKHAEGTIDQYVEHALKAGLDEIGFADHNPLPNGFDARHRMDESQFGYYIAMVADAQRKYPRITIKCGLEADYLPGGEAYLEKQLERYPLDYVYGSVHYLGDWNFDNPVFMHRWEDDDVDAVYLRYFDTLAKLITSGLFDIISHPDLVKKFGHRPKRLDLGTVYRDTAQLLSSANMCIEINTSGLRKEVGEIYPERSFLEEACLQGVPAVVGSDAHTPEDTGADIDRAIDLARSVGYTHIQQFTGRRRVPVAIT